MATTEGMDAAFAAKLNALIAASGGRLRITSGYRSVQRQKELFDAAVRKYGSVAAARKYVAPPGHSKHNEGIAADLSGDLAWAHAHAAQFGLYFPMSWETWHIEPVGSRSTKASRTTKPDGYALGPGNPDELASLAPDAPNLHDPKVQLANFFAILTTPSSPSTGVF